MTLNGVMAVILRYFFEFDYAVVVMVTQLLDYTSVSKSTFDSLWPYWYDLRDYSASIWAQQEEAVAYTTDVVAYAHVSWWVSCASGQAHIVQYGGLDGRVHFNCRTDKTRFDGRRCWR